MPSTYRLCSNIAHDTLRRDVRSLQCSVSGSAAVCTPPIDVRDGRGKVCRGGRLQPWLPRVDGRAVLEQVEHATGHFRELFIDHGSQLLLGVLQPVDGPTVDYKCA